MAADPRTTQCDPRATNRDPPSATHWARGRERGRSGTRSGNVTMEIKKQTKHRGDSKDLLTLLSTQPISRQFIAHQSSTRRKVFPEKIRIRKYTRRFRHLHPSPEWISTQPWVNHLLGLIVIHAPVFFQGCLAFRSMNMIRSQYAWPCLFILIIMRYFRLIRRLTLINLS